MQTMKKMIQTRLTRAAVVVLVALALMLSRGAFAAEEIKIGMVNFQQAINDVEHGKKAKAALKSEFDQKQKKLNVQQDELKKLQEEAEKQKSVLSQEALLAKQKTFNDKLGELQKNMASYRDDLVAKEGRMTSQILENLKTVVGEIGQKEGYTLIVETSQNAVLFAKVKEDLTSRVVSSYNQRFTGPLSIQ